MSSSQEYQRQWYLKNREKRLTQCRAHYAANKERKNQYAKAWAARNPEKRKAINKRSRIKRASYLKEQNRLWHINNRQRHRDRRRKWFHSLSTDRRAVMAERLRVYYRNNRERFYTAVAKRKAIKMAVSVNTEKIAEWMRSVRSKLQVKCYYCNNWIAGRRVHFDHVIPLTRGGPHRIENLAVSCRFCNLSKNKYLPQEWRHIGQLFFSI